MTIIEICALIAVIIFSVLTFFIIRTLISLQKTLEKVDRLTQELNFKSAKMDSLFSSIANVGDILEEKSLDMRENYIQKKECSCRKREPSSDLEDLIVASFKFCANYLRRE